MRRAPIALGLVTILMLSAVVAPALAVTRTTTGSRINLFLGNQAYQANTAFFVRDGFNIPTGAAASGKYLFTLDVDGVSRAADFKTNTTLSDGSVSRLWIFNFPDGMTGTHVFTGDFVAPCGPDTAPCGSSRPNTPLVFLTISATVTFTV
jgi:hypothetical protein